MEFRDSHIPGIVAKIVFWFQYAIEYTLLLLLQSPSSRSPDTRDREVDDVSDSGVMSLPTSEDISEADFQDFKMVGVL